MPRTPVKHTDIVGLIVAALNNASVNSGTLKAVANGQEVKVVAHNDAPNQSYNDQFCIYVH